MTALHLRRIDTGRNMQRFYLFDVQPDLFGRVLLIREFVRIGVCWRLIDESYDNEASAVAAMRRQADKKRKRGYI